ncbi:hypothetical protein AB0M20_00545 [Actinoplanes sp. NPDC051633]|uniref:hypothetical protein n=1 Tax=Actinoplanes sp. NPDC051633 TaxID=3155670 RepID=UPI0034427B09
MSNLNVPLAHAWLRRAITANRPDFWTNWWAEPSRLIDSASKIVTLDTWGHDYWIANQFRFIGISGTQGWACTRELDSFPVLGAEAIDLGFVTTSDSLDSVLASARPLLFSHQDSIADFKSLSELQRGLVVAWLDTLIGPGLRGLALSDTDDAGLIFQLAQEWINTALRMSSAMHLPGRVVIAVESIYTTYWTDGGPQPTANQQGESADTREAWMLLLEDLEVDDLLSVLRVTTRVLCWEPLFYATLQLATLPAGRPTTPWHEAGISPVACCIIRRWAVGLRVLAWLEIAVGHKWSDVRTKDLHSFAFAALRPWWPRPTVAISHRSGDAKTALKRGSIWGSPLVAIDACTLPNWETNTGMVWRLFAPTPMILRVESPNYHDSLWCRREFELSTYLAMECDFLPGRKVGDISVDDFDVLASAVATLQDGAKFAYAPVPRGPFPPETMVLDVPELPRIVIDLLAAVATLRIMNVVNSNVIETNRIGRLLAFGGSRELVGLPTEWKAVRSAFFRLGALCSDAGGPVRLAAPYPDEQRQIDAGHFLPGQGLFDKNLPDRPDQLAALEWDLQVVAWFARSWGPAKAVLDCRNMDQRRWVESDSQGLRRGMLRIWTDTQLCVLQAAGQGVDQWPMIGVGDTPILTQHVDHQFDWMLRTQALPTWILAYTSLPEIEFDKGVLSAVIKAMANEFRRFPGLQEPTAYGDLFGPTEDVLNRIERLLDGEPPTP